MGTYLTEGIVLKHSPWRETDRTLVMYTRTHGKLTIMARGARKILSKLAGSVEPVTRLQATVVHGRRNDTLAGAEELYTFPQLRRNLSAMSMAMLISEVIDRSTFTRQHDSRVFDLLDRTLRDLEQAAARTSADIILVAWRFVWQFLAAVGYHPELFHCADCHQKIKQEDNWFDCKKGGLVCPTCHRASPDQIAVTPAMIKLIRWLVSTPSPVKLKVPAAMIQPIGRLTNTYLNYTHEHDLDFRPFLKLV